VVTQLEFERELANGGTGGMFDGAPAAVVMVLCAGQRDEAVPYCSGVCCAWALEQAGRVKAAAPRSEVTMLFRDLYLPGEDTCRARVAEARNDGVRLVRYSPSSPPLVTDEEVRVCDASTGEDLCLQYDRVVLATPLVPQPDAGEVARLCGISRDANGFFPEVRYRLRPGDCAERGILVCGAAHSPVGRAEAEFEGTAAAFRALRHVRMGRVTSCAPVAVVDGALCTGCAGCVEQCAFGAISIREQAGLLDVAVVDPMRCKGCGNCVVACPVKAIHVPIDSDAQVLAQIDAALAEVDGSRTSLILGFACEWSGYAAAELAGASGLSYPPEVRLVCVRCSARVDPIHVLWALFRGAGGVFVGACGPGDCHYVNGNRCAQERVERLQDVLAANGFDRRRLRLDWIVPDDPHDLVAKLGDFADLVRRLGPSRVHRDLAALRAGADAGAQEATEPAGMCVVGGEVRSIR
jgi:heterodisulfide reductase subunit A